MLGEIMSLIIYNVFFIPSAASEETEHGVEIYSTFTGDRIIIDKNGKVAKNAKVVKRSYLECNG